MSRGAGADRDESRGEGLRHGLHHNQEAGQPLRDERGLVRLPGRDASVLCLRLPDLHHHPGVARDLRHGSRGQRHPLHQAGREPRAEEGVQGDQRVRDLEILLRPHGEP